MTAPLTSHEWKLLHRAMDRVERQKKLAPPDSEKIHAAALATYEHQGIDVSEEVIRAAVDGAVADWHQEHPRPSSVQIPGRPSDWVLGLSQAWGGVPPEENLLGVLPIKEKHSKIFFQEPFQEWRRVFVPLLEHQPWSSDQLNVRLSEATRFQLGRWRQAPKRALFCGLLSAVLLSVSVGMGIGWVGIAIGFFPLFLAGRAWLRGVDAQAKLSVLGEALEGLERREWECPALPSAARGVGVLVRGSLRPLAADDPSWVALKRRCASAPETRARWEQWSASPALRENDREVLLKMLELMDNHPARQLLRKVGQQLKNTVQPLLRGSLKK